MSFKQESHSAAFCLGSNTCGATSRVFGNRDEICKHCRENENRLPKEQIEEHR